MSYYADLAEDFNTEIATSYPDNAIKSLAEIFQILYFEGTEQSNPVFWMASKRLCQVQPLELLLITQSDPHLITAHLADSNVDGLNGYNDWFLFADEADAYSYAGIKQKAVDADEGKTLGDILQEALIKDAQRQDLERASEIGKAFGELMVLIDMMEQIDQIARRQPATLAWPAGMLPPYFDGNRDAERGILNNDDLIRKAFMNAFYGPSAGARV